MIKTRKYHVYFQGEDEYFLNIKVTSPSLITYSRLFRAFLNEFHAVYGISQTNLNDLSFYHLDGLNEAPVTELNFRVPENPNSQEYLIRPKTEIIEKCRPRISNQTKYNQLCKKFLQYGQKLENQNQYIGAYYFYSAAGSLGSVDLAKMFFKLEDWNNVYQLFDELYNYIHIPIVNEIIGYTYENRGNIQKALETFSSMKEKEPTQLVAYSRLSPDGENPLAMGPLIDDMLLSTPCFEKSFTYEIVNSYLTSCFYKEAVEFTIQKGRFYSHNAKLLTTFSGASSMLVKRLSSSKIGKTVVKKTCLILLKNDKTDDAINLAKFNFEFNKKDPRAAFILMFVYFYVSKYKNMIDTFCECLCQYSINQSIGEFSVKEFYLILSNEPEFESLFRINDGKQDEFPSFIENTEQNSYSHDIYRFFIIPLIFLYIANRIVTSRGLMMKIHKTITNASLDYDEIREIYSIISNISGLYDNSRGKKIISVLGDYTSLSLCNLVVDLGEVNARFEPAYIPGLSLWDLRSDQFNFQRKEFMKKAKEISQSELIVLTLGRKDCEILINKLVLTNYFTSLDQACQYFAQLYIEIANTVQSIAPKATIIIVEPFSKNKNFWPTFECFAKSLKIRNSNKFLYVATVEKISETTQHMKKENKFEEPEFRDLIITFIQKNCKGKIFRSSTD
ncbi:hypothetical protein TRFO_18591 [Tritrichomonas foetus]|uniref:Uncharacterized protein n=1 Tax=Tritrichomonas foetus TaxID=1144522 RepID=A0A1J4KKH7_9EUKA|nr:hypothetical protein TRFO_18591 [Tritrichomonas foetus]|eukprot:OHT11809.1 hypothetical protein TRFO_18591 [Tritrichomonas foetus]